MTAFDILFIAGGVLFLAGAAVQALKTGRIALSPYKARDK